MFSMEWEQFAAHNFNELPYLIVVTSHRKTAESALSGLGRNEKTAI